MFKLYKRYDKLKDPTRFLVFFFPAVIVIGGIYVPNIWVNYTAWAILLIALISRAIYIHK